MHKPYNQVAGLIHFLDQIFVVVVNIKLSFEVLENVCLLIMKLRVCKNSKTQNYYLTVQKSPCIELKDLFQETRILLQVVCIFFHIIHIF